jgi:hypothetical protein
MPQAFNLNNAGASVESVEYENRSLHHNSLISPAQNHPTQSWKGFEKLNPLNQMNSELETALLVRLYREARIEKRQRNSRRRHEAVATFGGEPVGSSTQVVAPPPGFFRSNEFDVGAFGTYATGLGSGANAGRRRGLSRSRVSATAALVCREDLTTFVHWSEMSSGGHFAALEQSDLMLADLRAFVSTVAGEQH